MGELAVRLGSLHEATGLAGLRQVAQDRSDVRQEPRVLDVAEEVHGRGLGGGHPHRAGVGLHRDHRRPLEAGLGDEADAVAPGGDRPLRAGRHHLELLWGLVRCPVLRGRREDAHVVGRVERAHEVVDEPARRRRAGRPMLHRHDHVEAATRADEPALAREEAGGLLQVLGSDPQGRDGLGPLERVASPALKRVDELLETARPIGTHCGPGRGSHGSPHDSDIVRKKGLVVSLSAILVAP